MSLAQRKPYGENRQHILDTALKLFGTNGYFNTSLQDIRRESGLSIGAIYHHFNSKEELARALYQSLLESMDAAIKSAIIGKTSCQDQCKAITTALFQMTEQEPRLMHFLLHAKHREFLPDEPPICSASPFRAMRDQVRKGIEMGEVRPMDPMVAAACLFGGPIRLIQLKLDGVFSGSLNDELELVWECAWRGIAV